jgi:hypothetical protein
MSAFGGMGAVSSNDIRRLSRMSLSGTRRASKALRPPASLKKAFNTDGGNEAAIIEALFAMPIV